MDNILAFLNESKNLVETKLRKYLENGEPLLNILHESVEYSLYSGGKRIRPVFCFLVGDLFGVGREKLTSIACAVEMIHTASLSMDDLPHMDGAKMRRGKPANHVVYGQDVAALASIGLLTRAYEIVLNDPLLPDSRKSQVVGELAKTVGINGMVGGQFVDLKFSRENMEYPTLEYIHNHKTASLFVATGMSAAIVSGAKDREKDAIERYARCLGFAFQVMDDLIDMSSTEEVAGKDLKKDKGNFVKVFGEKRSYEIIQEYAQKAGEALSIFAGKEENLLFLRDLILLKAKKGSATA